MYRQVCKVEQAHQDCIWSVAWGAIDLIVTGSVDQAVQVWDGSSETLQKSLVSFDSHLLGVVSVAVSGDGKLAASSAIDGFVRVYDLQEKKENLAFQAVSDTSSPEAWCIAFHPHKPLLFSGSFLGHLVLWDVVTGEKQSSHEAHDKLVMSIAVSPDGNLVATASYDGSITVFDVETQKILHRLSGHKLAVRDLTFTSDSSALISASEDSFINIYEMKTGEQLHSLSGHGSWVLGVAASSLGTQFVSCSCDKKVKVWDWQTKECVHTFDSHADQVWSVAYSPDGRKVASVSDDFSLQIFEAHQ